MDELNQLPDDALIERLQRAAFSYLTEYANPDNGLVADTSRNGSPCSIAVVGFALSCYPVAVENGWLSRAEAASRDARGRCDFFRTARRATARTRPATRASTTTSSTCRPAGASGNASCRWSTPPC